MDASIANPAESINKDIEFLETRLKDLLVLQDLASASSAAQLNEIRTALKNIGSNLARNGSDENLVRVHKLIKQQLLPSQNETSANEASNVLSFLRLLIEICPLNAGLVLDGSQDKERFQDMFWKEIIEPVFYDILVFFKINLFQWSLKNLSSQDHPEALSEISESYNHGSGFAFHQQLGVLQKGVRILLIYLKRVTAGMCEIEKKQQMIEAAVTDILSSLCALMNPKDHGCSRDFDIGLDIRCNIGVAICYSMYYLLYEDKELMRSFFESIFDANLKLQTDSCHAKLVDQVLSLTTSDINKIALGFGILNTWLEKEHDARLYFLIPKSILEIHHGVKEAVNLGSSRVLEVWIEKLARSTVPSSVVEHVSGLFVQLEFFAFMYMPGHIDAVKNCCRNMLSSISRVYDRLDENGYHTLGGRSTETWISNLLKTILDKPGHIRWLAISCVAKNTSKSLKILDLDPNLPDRLLCAYRTFKNAANEAYVALMSYHFQTVSESEWEKTWIKPLFTTQHSQHNAPNWPQKRSIISIILNSEKSQSKQLKVMITPMLRSIVKTMNCGSNSTIAVDSNGENLNVDEASLLGAEAIKMAYELKIKIDPKDLDIHSDNPLNSEEDSFRGLVPRSVLHNWLWSENSQTRLAGFALLVETKKTSELISKHDFESLKLFLKYSLVSQIPSFRQQVISYFKKLVRRLKDGEGYGRRTKNANVIDQYKLFLKWLWNFLTEEEGLFYGANFGRRCQALECLSELTVVFTDFEVFGEAATTNNVKCLHWLTDSFENNKIQALEVLVRLPIKDFENENFCHNLFNEAMGMCKSVKPPDSVTGRYLMALLIRKCSQNVNTKYTAWGILESLYLELVQMRQLIEKTSLVKVSSESPLYGCVRCVRMVLQTINDFKLKQNILKYRDYVEKILKLCLEVDDILFPVLGSAAPEGFLPGLKDSCKDNKQVVRSLAAQTLLVCAWRTMKEICLLMSDMCSLFIMEGEAGGKSGATQDNFLLSCEQVSQIGDHLLYLLKNLMHRGVFEQVYVGFKIIANRLWKSSNPKLSRLPEKWLRDAMDQEHISAKSITRRSAGLPFIFQALLSAESDNDVFLHKWLERLLIFDENPDMSPIRIHSMNVLRGLFRDTSFSAAMMPFVPHGLKMSFRGLKSTDWTERNSGLMLYGAVMRRSFGPKFNLMNAPTFFRKFPQMYDFLLNELDICINRFTAKKNIEGDKLDESACDFTFHLLLLLSSFTTCGRVEDSHFKLFEFIPRIRKCGESNDMEVRKLAARAMIPFLVSPEEKRELSKCVLDEIKAEIKMSQNRIHGLLSQFLSIIEQLPKDDSETCKSENSKICSAFLDYLSKDLMPHSFKAPTVYEVITEILVSLHTLQCAEKGVILKALESVEAKYRRQFKDMSNRNFVPGLPVADKNIARAVIEISFDELNRSSFLEMIYNYLINPSKSIVYIEQYLELGQKTSKVWSLFSDGTAIEEALTVVEAMIGNYLDMAVGLFVNFPGSELEFGYLKYMEQIPVKFLELCYYENSEMIETFVKRLFKVCNEQESTTPQLKALSFMMLGKIAFATSISISEENITKLCDMVILWAASGVDDDMRQAVAESFPLIPFQNMSNYSSLNQAKIWSSVFMLAQDDETDLREIVNRKLKGGSSSCCDRKALEILTTLYFQSFLSSNPIEGLLVLIGLILRENFEVEAKAADDETEDRLFDKSEMNMYFEHQTMMKTVKNQLELLPASDLQTIGSCVDLSLSDEQINFLNVVSNSDLGSCPALSRKCIRQIIEQESAKYPDLNCDAITHNDNINRNLGFTSNKNDTVRMCIQIFLQSFLKILT